MKYQLHTDHHMAIGYMHLSDGKPCQDHALSGVFKGYETMPHSTRRMAYAVVSDGCSTGGETDIGARLITTMTANTLQADFSTSKMGYSLRSLLDDHLAFYDKVIPIAEKMGLSSRDLEATQIYAVIDGNGHGRVHIKGDGVVVLGHLSGALTVYRFEWANNAPFYPLYSMYAKLRFSEFHGGSEVLAFSETKVTIAADGEVKIAEPVLYTVEQGMLGVVLPIVDASDLSMIGLFTDGVCQVDRMEWLDAVRGLMAFKNRAGSFAKRRSIRFIKDTLKAGHGPNDDLSMAVISITPAEVDETTESGVTMAALSG